MSSDEIDAYLEALDEPRRSTLAALRRTIAEAIPEAEEGLSYGAPVFRIDGRPIAGFAAAARHLSYLPHSGTVLGAMTPEELRGFAASKGSLRMPVDTPLPADLVGELIRRRRAEAGV